MTEVGEALLQPPRWARAFLLFALPCDPIRDAILGDLHEEFLGDATGDGVRSARARYVRRTAGIVVRALADAMIFREWVSTDRVAAPSRASVKLPGHGGGAAGSFTGFVIIALFVLAAAVVVNTMLFSASRARGVHGSSAAGIGAVVLLVACVGIGAVVVCAGPRWQRNRRRDR